MAQIVTTEIIALSEKESQAFELVTSILEDIARKTNCKDINDICYNAITEINAFWEYVELS